MDVTAHFIEWLIIFHNKCSLVSHDARGLYIMIDRIDVALNEERGVDGKKASAPDVVRLIVSSMKIRELFRIAG